MKKILTTLLSVVVALAATAQDFEGTLKYNYTVKVSEKIKSASDEMSKPENKEKMKQLQEQMKDPAFQKILEGNPKLKEQMDAMIKAQSSGSGNLVENMMPKSSTMFMKNGNYYSKSEGGMGMDFLFIKATNKSYQLNRDPKTYTVTNSTEKNPSADKKVLKAVKTTETTKVLGYTCTKYVIDDKGTKMYFWNTKEIKGIDYEKIKAQMSQNQHGGIEGLEGVTLKMQVVNAQMDMTMEAVELKKQSVDSGLFVIPADYKETKMPEIMMKK